MSLDNLHRRIDTLLAAIEQQRGPALDVQSGFGMHLFAEQEQIELRILLAQIEPNIGIFKGCLDLRGLSDIELDTLSLWAYLKDALEQENIDAAAKYRRHIACSQEQLITQFLSIPESSIPESDQVLKVDGRTFYRTQFRADKARIERAIAANRLRRSELDTMRLWCETFAAAA